MLVKNARHIYMLRFVADIVADIQPLSQPLFVCKLSIGAIMSCCALRRHT